jgi:hypothetical protein
VEARTKPPDTALPSGRALYSFNFPIRVKSKNLAANERKAHQCILAPKLTRVKVLSK